MSCLDIANRRAVDAALCLKSSILKKAWMSLVDVFRGKCLMHLRALVCRVWMLVAVGAAVAAIVDAEAVVDVGVSSPAMDLPG